MRKKGLLSRDFDGRTIINYLLYSIVIVMPFIILPGFNQKYINGKVIFIYFVFITISIFVVMLRDIFHIRIEEIISFIFLTSLVISTIFSLDKETALIGKTGRYEGLLMYIVYVGIFIFASKYLKISRKVIDILGVVASTMSIYTILQFLEHDFIFPGNTKYDAFGTIGNRNFTATYLLLFLVIIISAYILFNKKRYLLYSCIIFTALLSTLTRSCWVGLAVSAIIACITFFENKDRFKRCMIVLFSFVIIFIIMNYNSGNEIIGRAEISADVTDETGSGRIQIWKGVLASLKESPILGSGPDTLDTRIAHYAPDSFFSILDRRGVPDKAHNEFLEYWACGGLFTMLSYIVLCTIVLVKLYKNRKDDLCKVFLFIIVGYLVQSFFNISVVAVAPLYWIILGAAVKHYRALENKEKEIEITENKLILEEV